MSLTNPFNLVLPSLCPSFRGTGPFGAVRVTKIETSGYVFTPMWDARAADAPDADWQPIEGAEFLAWPMEGIEPSEDNALEAIEILLAGPSPADLLAVAKARVRGLAKARRTELITGGFEFRGKRIQTRDTQDIINVQKAAFAATLMTGFATDWITADNSLLPLDAEGMIEMELASTAYGNAIFTAFTALQVQIKDCTTVEQVEALEETARTFPV